MPDTVDIQYMFVKLYNTMQKIVSEAYAGEMECSGHFRKMRLVSLGGGS